MQSQLQKADKYPVIFMVLLVFLNKNRIFPAKEKHRQVLTCR
jgi:hypothetical protein